jgi:hypothetical protein
MRGFVSVPLARSTKSGRRLRRGPIFAFWCYFALPFDRPALMREAHQLLQRRGRGQIGEEVFDARFRLLAKVCRCVWGDWRNVIAFESSVAESQGWLQYAPSLTSMGGRARWPDPRLSGILEEEGR